MWGYGGGRARLLDYYVRFFPLSLAVIFTGVLGAGATDIPVKLEDSGKSGYHASAAFKTTASKECIYGVLTDYERLPSLMPLVKSNVVKERREGGVLLDQVDSERVLWIRHNVHVLLAIEEAPYAGYTFEDTSHDDFKVYRGRWSIVPDGAGYAVTIETDIVPGFFAPSILARYVIRKDVAMLLRAVRDEISRRNPPSQAIALKPTKVVLR